MDLQTRRLRTIEQTEGNETVTFQPKDRNRAYAFIEGPAGGLHTGGLRRGTRRRTSPYRASPRVVTGSPRP